MTNFTLTYLDHVALRVKDLEASANWYEKVLGLERKQVAEWKPFPILLMAGQTGIALFPANTDEEALPISSKAVKVDHFAFRVAKEDFLKVKARYEELDLEFTIQNHHYFESIYTFDPDGHKVEITSLIREDFF